MPRKIAHNRPQITAEDESAVLAVLRSGWIAQGSQVESLEQDFCRYLGGGAACAVSSGTAALFLALVGTGVEPGDKVAVPTYTCSAVLNAVYMARAEPILVDVRASDFTIDPLRLAEGSSRAVIAVHCFGAQADIENLKSEIVIEDCCQSLGGSGNQRPFGTAAVFSFYATKMITGGQGGLLWARHAGIAEAARDYRNFDGRDTYKPRFNLQTTDIAAAMIRSQFRRLSGIAARRRNIADRYASSMPNGISRQAGLDGIGAVPYRFVLRLPSAKARDALQKRMTEADIDTIVPIQRFELLHRYLGLDPQAFPVAEKIADTTLSLPLYPALEDADVDRVCMTLERFSA